MLPGDGAALQRRLQPVSYKHKQQLSAVHLLHTLQGLLLGHRGTYRLFRLLKDSNITVHVICMHKGFIVNSECSYRYFNLFIEVQQSSDGLLQSYQSCICFCECKVKNLLLLLRSVFKLSTTVGPLLRSSNRKLTKVINFH